ncbi:hypothetical protein C3L50_11025 [Flavobacterium alvei]|uniref:DZANK-type domain-containing protein n=1 Tax=Flavobacterium alvei TaxID=2080416 RepID=A0A2S5A7V1_9FLAO|nr:hypothetical protein [Flavobacterium alvei]POY38668.1 hypothetical protein C3L50_11025 [Flavobacterium alvei]
MSTELHCPKCGSNQITSDKKGFSGKKAVAGALLTGGIGILAGTIGSNKIKITCLSCGHEFKPGEGEQVHKPQQYQENKESDEKYVGNIEPLKKYKCGHCQKISTVGSNKHCPKCGYNLSNKDIYIEKIPNLNGLLVFTVIIIIVITLFFIFK